MRVKNQLQSCRLCGSASELRHSHIVPEFLYKDQGLYNHKKQMIGFTGNGPKGYATIHKGLRDYLLCDACEQFINENFEKPFRKLWVEHFPLPNPWKPNLFHFTRVDYATFKLFHLSVLFRASVSTAPTFAAVHLGPHEARIRQMLLSLDSGPDWLYPIAGRAPVNPLTGSLIPLVSRAYGYKKDGKHVYSMNYGCVEWSFGISNERHRLFESLALRADGLMTFSSVSLREMPFFQEVKQILDHADAP